jgi:hypothetical protein
MIIFRDHQGKRPDLPVVLVLTAKAHLKTLCVL